jgi:hypothetical protein
MISAPAEAETSERIGPTYWPGNAQVAMNADGVIAASVNTSA